MMVRRWRYIAILAAAVGIVTLHHVQQWLNIRPLESMVYYQDLEERPLEEGQTCHVPLPHPFDPSVLPYVGFQKPIRCFDQPQLTMVDQDGVLRFNDSALREAGYAPGTLRCYYNEILRPQGNDYSTEFGETVSLLREAHPASDFVYVKCDGFRRYRNFHAHVQKKSKRKLRDGEFSVAVLGIDSMSRLNFMRQLPRTYRRLEDLGAVVFRGFHKVGDNTFPNIVPVLTGQVPSPPPYEHFDNLPLVWKSFSDDGYVTLFSEDMPRIATFNWVGSGFLSPPTDHYFRPFWLAAEGSLLHGTSASLCLGSVPKHRIYFRYLKSFMQAYRDSPQFLFSFNSEASHDYIDTVGAADADVDEFLQDVNSSGLLDRTFLFVMSDHGHRFAAIRQTPQGRVEERLPFLAILPPATVDEDLRRNLRNNADRLAAMFDIHATFLDIHGRAPQQGPGLSLLRPVPLNRTCRDAGVPDSFCTCHREQGIPTDDPRAVRAADALLTHVRRLLLGTSRCAPLQLSAVKNAALFDAKVLVVVETVPGKALFEALVDEGGRVAGSLSRINRYAKQADCLSQEDIKSNPVLPLICYCQEVT